MAYTDVAAVRLLSNISSSTISDNDINSFISLATQQLNYDISYAVEDEEVKYIDEVKQNDIDGVNKTYYVQKQYIGDKTNSGSLTTSDVEVYSIDSDGTKTYLTISSIDSTEGSVTLSTAPSSVRVFLNYRSCPLQVDDAMLSKACTELSNAYAHSRIEPHNIKRIGRMTLGNGSEFDFWYKQYQNTVRTILARRTPSRIDGNGIEF